MRLRISQSQQSLQRKHRSQRWLAQQSLVQNKQISREPSPQIEQTKVVVSVGVIYLRLRMV